MTRGTIVTKRVAACEEGEAAAVRGGLPLNLSAGVMEEGPSSREGDVPCPGGTERCLLEIEAEPELRRPGEVALREHLAECVRAPVLVRRAVGDPVEQVADLRLEPDAHLVAQREHLEDVDVLAVVRPAAYVGVAFGRGAELQRARIRPSGLVQID